jgi:hypothetical protein
VAGSKGRIGLGARGLLTTRNKPSLRSRAVLCTHLDPGKPSPLPEALANSPRHAPPFPAPACCSPGAWRPGFIANSRPPALDISAEHLYNAPRCHVARRRQCNGFPTRAWLTKAVPCAPVTGSALHVNICISSLNGPGGKWRQPCPQGIARAAASYAIRGSISEILFWEKTFDASSSPTSVGHSRQSRCSGPLVTCPGFAIGIGGVSSSPRRSCQETDATAHLRQPTHVLRSR